MKIVVLWSKLLLPTLAAYLVADETQGHDASSPWTIITVLGILAGAVAFVMRQQSQQTTALLAQQATYMEQQDKHMTRMLDQLTAMVAQASERQDLIKVQSESMLRQHKSLREIGQALLVGQRMEAEMHDALMIVMPQLRQNNPTPPAVAKP